MIYISYFKSIIFNVLELLIIIFIFTILFYFNIINEKTYSIIKLISLLVTVFINSLFIGSKSKTKKYIEGIKYGLIVIGIMFIITLLLSKVNTKLLVYYPLILITSILGSMMSKIKKAN